MLKKVIWFFVITISLGLLRLSLYLYDLPPLKLYRTDNIMTVDVQTLGEYSTGIERIKIIQKSNEQKVWEIVAKGKTPHLHKFTLVCGKNPLTPKGINSNDYTIVFPKNEGNFELMRGESYRIVVVGNKETANKAILYFPVH